MLRAAVTKIAALLRVPAFEGFPQFIASRQAHGPPETEEEFIAKYVYQFNRWDIDGWEIRKAMNDLLGMDLVPDPKIIIAGMRACRKVNDFALAVRWLEGCKDKCGDHTAVLFPYLMKDIKPTMDELGVPTLEEMLYHEPQLALKSVYDM